MLSCAALATLVLACALGAATSPTAKPPARSAAAKPAARPGSKATTPARRASAPKAPLRSPGEQARNVIALNTLGLYGQATDALRALRAYLPLDGDLEIALALAEGRSGDLDSAAVRLYDKTLSAAYGDSLPNSRRFDYQFGYERLWLDGKFTGWNWYVARARAEIDARLGRWDRALVAARACVAARPLAGKEYVILAIAAGKNGAIEESDAAAREALALDPTLPEAYYLAGLVEWRAGRRAEARLRMETAISIDSTYREPALALVKLRLAGARPDTLPNEYLTGLRACGLVTSSFRPKLEELIQMEREVVLTRPVQIAMPDSIHLGSSPIEFDLPVLIDPRGRIAMHELPAYNPSLLPGNAVNVMLSTLPLWEFDPALRHGLPTPAWTAVQIVIHP